MSTVRMCDYLTPDGPCGVIFSEKEDGWSSGRISVVRDGTQVTEAADFCPDHTGNPKTVRNYPRFRPTPPALQSPESSSKEDWSLSES